MSPLKRCDLYGLSEDHARASLRVYVAASQTAGSRCGSRAGGGERSPQPAKSGVPFPGKKFALSNIPIRVPRHFLGRDDAIAAIDAALKRDEGRVAITALHGLRGVGKTTLAAAYAERHRADYRATWWIRAQTELTMRADLVALGVRLGWVAADEKEEAALRHARATEARGRSAIIGNHRGPRPRGGSRLQETRRSKYRLEGNITQHPSRERQISHPDNSIVRISSRGRIPPFFQGPSAC